MNRALLAVDWAMASWWALLAGLLLLAVWWRWRTPADRDTIRREFSARLRQRWPGSQVLEDPPWLIVRRSNGGEGRYNLVNLAGDAARARLDSRARQQMYDRWLDGDPERDANAPFEEVRSRVLPRLVTGPQLEQLREMRALPSRELAGADLQVVYVVDSPYSVMFINNEMAEHYGLDSEALHALALENLRPRLPANLVRDVIAERKMIRIMSGDTFEAARLLIVPEHLRDDEEVAAILPDRDILLLAPVPDDEVWQAYGRLAGELTGGEHPLLLRVLRVTATGYELR